MANEVTPKKEVKADSHDVKYKVALVSVLDAAERGLIYGNNRKSALQAIVEIAKSALEK